MRCIFCGNDSSTSKSVEHIVLASFGNSISVLPKGIVCDKCNNYFARKIEYPFLNSEAVLQLRQELDDSKNFRFKKQEKKAEITVYTSASVLPFSDFEEKTVKAVECGDMYTVNVPPHSIATVRIY